MTVEAPADLHDQFDRFIMIWEQDGSTVSIESRLDHWAIHVYDVRDLIVESVMRDRRRKKRGWCLNCGYDLRGVEARCPECGTGKELVVSAEG